MQMNTPPASNLSIEPQPAMPQGGTRAHHATMTRASAETTWCCPALRPAGSTVSWRHSPLLSSAELVQGLAAQELRILLHHANS